MSKYIKQILDICISIILLVLTIPLVILISCIIKIESKGKIFYKQKRIGKDGKIITIYKFRTMVDNAEKLVNEFTEKQKEEYEKNYKLLNDYRVTRFGNFLRKTGLDELPQLVNVLKGEMSIVGPRPVVEEEIKKYGKYWKKVFSVKPGITGYWVVKKNKNTTYDERIKMDLYYVENLSVKLDTKILLKTIKIMLKGKNE